MDFFAKSYVKHARTFLTPKDVIDSYETFEYFLVKVFGRNLSLGDFQDFEAFLKQFQSAVVTPGREHMCSLINGIMVSEEGVASEVAKTVKRYAHAKSYLFSLKGWSEIRIAAVDLAKGEVVISRRGKKLQKLCSLQK